jgi:hypothetical protein
MGKARTIFDAIVRQRAEPLEDWAESFVPTSDENFEATTATPGTPEKIEVLRLRMETGQPLWHEDDVVLAHDVSPHSPLHRGMSPKIYSGAVIGYQRGGS